MRWSLENCMVGQTMRSSRWSHSLLNVWYPIDVVSINLHYNFINTSCDVPLTFKMYENFVILCFLPCIILSELNNYSIYMYIFQASFTAYYCLSATDSSSCRPIFPIQMLCDNVRCQNPTKNFRVICQDFQLAHMYALASGGTGQCYFIFAGCEVIQCVYYACIIQYSKCLHVSTCALWTLSCNGKRCHFVRYVLSHDFDGKWMFTAIIIGVPNGIKMSQH